MKFSDFENEIRRLKKVYGEAKYPDERTGAMFEAMSPLPYDAFKKQVTRFIAERERAPLLSCFVEAFGPMLADLKKQEILRKLDSEPNCGSCGNTGVFIAYTKTGFFSHAIQCKCKRGALLWPHLARVDEIKQEDFVSHGQWTTGKYKLEKINGQLRVALKNINAQQ